MKRSWDQTKSLERYFKKEPLSGEEYEEISSCETANKMWDKLEVTYEGTNKVKETRMNLLVRDYESFQIKDGESVEEMFSRFSKILGDLKSFGRPIKSGKQADSTRKEEDSCIQSNVAKPENEKEEEGGEQNENIAMLSQVVTSMMRKNRNSRRGKPNFRNGRTNNDNNKNSGRYYECGKHGHIQVECPEPKKKLGGNFQKKKSVGAWSDEEEYDHEEIANMCFMSIKEDNNNDSGELGLMADVGTCEEENSCELGLMEDEGTSEVRLPTCPNYYELQEFVDIALVDIERVLTELKKIKREKKDWALKLEVCETEQDMLQDEVNELQLQLNGLRKSTSHSSVKSNQIATHTSLIRTRNPTACSYCGKIGSRTTEDGFSDLNLLVKLILRALTIQDPNRLGYLKTIIKLDGGIVAFGDKSKGNVIGVEKVHLSSTCDVDEVYLVDELGYNLLGFSQLCGNDYEVHFKKHGWFIEDE
ncbi:PREDICTED: uncharacterized protein LOC109226164 [Nicotiana attenuata]|uniref:uncharacterized protein LOC109226164 n=1 Tax=Nicotiana attenuata TaxID=49451 RepID=UPI0009049109|nr:PREDICTED: uncharacterized protein LOC109226164 [Nicotiana attenuata]